MIFIRSPFLKQLKCIDNGEVINVKMIKTHIHEKFGVPEDAFNVYDNKCKLLPETVLPDDCTVYLLLSVAGGKGGFGSMLRAIGAQIEKTTNREACRDLSGRRLRDINEEQRLKSWLAKKAEREAAAVLRRQERLQRLRETPKHDFQDSDYAKERSELPERVNNALSAGLKKAGPSKKKRSCDVNKQGEPSRKKQHLWLGVEVSSDSEESDKEQGLRSDNNEASTDSIDISVSSQSSGEKEDSSKELFVVQSGEELHEEGECVIPCDAMPIVSPPKNDSKEISVDIKPKQVEKVDLESFNDSGELEELGLEKLKAMLIELGLKCGGTLTERAQRLWSVRGLESKDFPQLLRAKPSKNQK